MVTTPDFNNILGDKLTAFAPTTTGIPYIKKDKEMGMEIIKQMYDVGCLFDEIDNVSMVKDVFNAFATVELKYRGNTHTISDVLDDTFYTALAICFRKDIQNTNFAVLNNGITSIKSYIFSDSFHLDKAVTYASKAAYLTILIKYSKEEIIRFNPKVNLKDLEIKQFNPAHPLNELNKLNKLKKSNPEAFHYWYQIYKIIQENEENKQIQIRDTVLQLPITVQQAFFCLLTLYDGSVPLHGMLMHPQPLRCQIAGQVEPFLP